jgi:hypothetical protein
MYIYTHGFGAIVYYSIYGAPVSLCPNSNEIVGNVKDTDAPFMVKVLISKHSLPSKVRQRATQTVTA